MSFHFLYSGVGTFCISIYQFFEALKLRMKKWTFLTLLRTILFQKLVKNNNLNSTFLTTKYYLKTINSKRKNFKQKCMENIIMVVLIKEK